MEEPFPLGIPAPWCDGRTVDKIDGIFLLLLVWFHQTPQSPDILLSAVRVCVPCVDGIVFHQEIILWAWRLAGRRKVYSCSLRMPGYIAILRSRLFLYYVLEMLHFIGHLLWSIIIIPTALTTATKSLRKIKLPQGHFPPGQCLLSLW